MKKIYAVLFALASSAGMAQTTLTLQPSGATGKDALITSLNPTLNAGTHAEYDALAWTNGGNPVTFRSLVEFDLSSIPVGATIMDAELTLYSYNSPANGQHSTMSGSNAAYLQRITSTWDESTVTWNTQPSVTTTNQASLAASVSPSQNYNIDVTNMVVDMINNPGTSFGFRISLVTESAYRSLVFASSDNATSSLHPKLVITYVNGTPTCINIKPNAAVGKDALITSLNPTLNAGTHAEYNALAWTNGGNPVTFRSLVEFDLSTVPAGALITSAGLSLYSYNSPANGQHSTLSGSNEAYLQRITSTWDESTVTWNTQPTVTTQNQVLLPASVSPSQDYLNTNVAAMVQDMIDNPGTSYGFRISLVTESAYRSLVFASSDNATSSLHPELDVCYVDLSSVNEIRPLEMKFSVYPNPANELITVLFENQDATSRNILVFDAKGAQLSEITTTSNSVNLDVSTYTAGVYVVKVVSQTGTATQKITIY
jgi:hypothetical protein